MATLQKVNLGTPPTAVDGDTVRGANTKVNANVDVLNAQAALTSAAATIVTAQALTAAHVGKRVNINLPTAGTINVPSAATMGLDGIVHLRNVGTTLVTLAIATGSGDTIALTKLNAGESAVLDSDGTHAVGCLLRGRANTDNEAVSGNLSVGGATALANDATLNFSAGNQRGINWAAQGLLRWKLSSDGAAESGSSAGSNIILSRYSDTGAYVDSPITVWRTSGAVAFTQRPAFAGNTPWDSGNLTPSNYMPKSGGTFTGPVTFTGATAGGGLYIGTGGVLYIYDGLNGAINIRTGGAAKFFTLDAAGNGNALNGSWINGSDARLKSGIVEIDNPLDRILALRGVYYELKSNPGVRQVGVIAQEVQAQFPEVVSAMGGEDNYLGVSYGNLVGPLIEAVKELSSKLDAANKRIDKLEGGTS